MLVRLSQTFNVLVIETLYVLLYIRGPKGWSAILYYIEDEFYRNAKGKTWTCQKGC